MRRSAAISSLIAELESLVEYIANSRSQLVLNKAMDFPVLHNSVLYSPFGNRKLAIAVAIAFPIGLPLYLVGLSNQKALKSEILTVQTVCRQLSELIVNE